MDLADHNFARSVALFASTSKTGEALESRDIVLTNTRSPIAEFNKAFLKRPDHKLARTLDRAFAYYGAAGVPFRVQLRADSGAAIDALIARGCVAVASIPVMALPDARCDAFEVGGLELRVVRDEAGLDDFRRVAFESFGLPLEIAPIALTEHLLFDPDVTLIVGYVASQPACCSLLLATGVMAGIYWVGTLTAHRRRGLGAAATARAVAEGRQRGCTSACLQASALGAPVYRRMGFAEVRRYAQLDSGPAR